MAASAVQALMNPSLIISAKTERKEQLGGEDYVSLIPAKASP
ncbi:hypothetical protein [Falsirhodobacter sp. 1013]